MQYASRSGKPPILPRQLRRDLQQPAAVPIHDRHEKLGAGGALDDEIERQRIVRLELPETHRLVADSAAQVGDGAVVIANNFAACSVGGPPCARGPLFDWGHAAIRRRGSRPGPPLRCSDARAPIDPARELRRQGRARKGCSPPVPCHPHLEPGVQEGRLPGPSGASAWERTPAHIRRGNLASSIGSKSVWATRTPQGTLKPSRGPARIRTAFPALQAPGRSRTAYRRFYAAPRLRQRQNSMTIVSPHAPARNSLRGVRAGDRARC